MTTFQQDNSNQTGASGNTAVGDTSKNVGYWSNYSKSYNYPQNGTDIRPVERKDGTMSTVLFDLLSAGGPYGTEHRIRKIILDYLVALPKDVYDLITTKVDEKGNLIVTVGERGDTVFSCHMDTVHARECVVRPMVTTGPGPDKEGYVYGSIETPGPAVFWRSDTLEFVKPQALPDISLQLSGRRRHSLVPLGTDDEGRPQYGMKTYLSDDDTKGYVHSLRLVKHEGTPKYEPSVLGADDKLGCYVMLRMIRAGVQGLYIFHVGEECGAHGSNHIRDKTPEVLGGITKAVAFDRKGYGDIITSQGGRTASDDFAKALADQINPHLQGIKEQFSPCPNGIFTDTAVYSDLIPECTNLSVGYFEQHTSTEHFDLVWLEQIFLPAILQVDWKSLPATRKPEDRWSSYRSSGWWNMWSNDDYPAPTYTPAKPAALGKPPTKTTFEQRNPNCVPRTITAATPLKDVPTWFPDDGWIKGATTDGMQRMIQRYLLRASGSPAEVGARMIVDLMNDLRWTEAALEHEYLEGSRYNPDEEDAF